MSRTKLYGPGQLVPVEIPAETVGLLYRIGAEHGISVVQTIEMLAGGRALGPKPKTKAKKRNV